ncbi:EcsC family protein [Enterovirga sp.]|uniref:EcsC family protein n=1 Tax=Enterovirga sp. TaxID=2026350 RepID=UPI002B714514|nr:EcsC family protein [Enterovirga sp.]HMO29237.1 EcsC family protein [Enterovirga sp.]
MAALRLAVQALERSTLAGRLSAMAGKPIELIGQALPEQARGLITEAADRALRTALHVALRTLPDLPAGEPRGRGHRDTTLVAASGALGGAFGLVTLPIELPISTTLVLRAIAGIAREEGEDLSDPETAFACLQVFALGSRTESDDLASSGYFAVRTALARSVSQAAKLAAGRAIADSAPGLVKLLAQIASRFGIVVSQKVAASAVPVVGALGGAAVNAAFMAHFRTVARAHFTVRRLERRYGREPVRDAYEEISRNLR